MVQWEAFLKKHPYSGCRKKRPSGSSLPSAPLRRPDTQRLPLVYPPPLPPPSEGRGRSVVMEGAPRLGSREVSSPPSCRSVREDWGGGGGRG